MKIINLINIIHENTNQIEFGNLDNWDSNTFLKSWFRSNNFIVPNAPGLYWFVTDCDIELNERPISLTNNGCDFMNTSIQNRQVFTVAGVTKKENNERVIYNGHEGNVMNRVRAHFLLSNLETGALGISHYPLSISRWRLQYFTINDLNNISNLRVRSLIQNLLNSKTGRTALENAWRVKFGWPPLCKQ